MSDPILTTDDPAQEPVPAGAPPTPSQIGRYRIERVLGKGGFGLVYLASDEQLQRLVAVKVPHRKLVGRAEDAEAYLAEARTVASLDHPNIVPVHDVGSTAEFPCFVVSKYIDGTDLAARLRQSRLPLHEAVDLVTRVAEALHHAHRQGLVHRDIKPGNILLDRGGKPYVADFGLALREQDVGKGPRYAGTPAYMSPEQARGEGHRVDGRSDLFSLGVVLYELLTGRRPFHADTRDELLEQIATHEARPPRQWDDAIPKEVERICLKALSKRASERYTTAKDMADDLRHFLAHQTGPASLSVSQPPAALLGSSQPVPALVTPTAPNSDSQPLKIVPKGLRSFDAHDADFFLELLPGPRDREGLPDGIRFWKTRIEESDPDNTFTVGLIYGPSGCGKSSLVKAGLLPRLSSSVVAVYVEATADETETRLLNGLRKRCPALPGGLGLKETLASLRRGQGVPLGKKVLIVLDQFEQWLHAKKEEQNTELVQALRQCDGGRVQCVVMVRDDFWMAATRIMRELEVRLLEGQNSTAVDLFDLDHARKVLAAFGRAFGKLPESGSDTSKDQKAFLDQAVSGLAQEGKVISVRLALFAEMMKGKPWTPASLKEVGGTQGVGVTFLEETFSAATAPPEHRYHQKALLPESGTDIKGHMRSQDELLAASGYASRPKDFDDLIRILDGEIRLITPTDPEGKDEGEPGGVSPRSVGVRYYQLTHDYLVHSLRDWLTRKQKETRRGRAELLLADRAGVWNARPENRQLPSLWQWFQIKWHTAKKNWTAPQRKMMATAGRYFAVRGVVVALFLTVLGVAGWEGNGRLQAKLLRDRLRESTTAEVPGIVAEMAGYRRWVNPLLQEEYAQAKEDARKQLHASLALLPADSGQVDYLIERLFTGEPGEVVVIRAALSAHGEDLSGRLWELLLDPKNDQGRRFRAACALAVYAPEDPRWEKVSGDVAATLVIQKPFVIAPWTEALKGVGRWLIPPLGDLLVDEKRSISERGLIATVYGTYATDVPDAHGRLEKQLAHATAEDREALARKQASIGVALLVMGRGEKVWPLLKHVPDPTKRSYLIDRLAPGGIESRVLLARLEEEKEVSVRRAILLGLGEYGLDRMPPAERRNQLPRLLDLYRDDPDPAIHGAAEWLVRQWGASDQLKAIDKGLATSKASRATSAPGVEGQWYINGQGQTMVVVPRPGEFWMGEGGERHRKRIDRSFALASKEVTVDQFRQFRMDHRVVKSYAPTGDCPVNNVTWYEAAAYCNWLSEKEGIPKEQWCYQPNWQGKYAEGMDELSSAIWAWSSPRGTVADASLALCVAGLPRTTGMRMAPDYLKRTGYRLPTEAEWEYACRAGAGTGYAHGESVDLLRKYAWFSANSLGRSYPVGTLKPNDLGLFDLHGNVWEWCQDAYKSDGEAGEGKAVEDIVDIEDVKYIQSSHGRLLRGGSFDFEASIVRSAYRDTLRPANRNGNCGFRPARTFAP